MLSRVQGEIYDFIMKSSVRVYNSQSSPRIMTGNVILQQNKIQNILLRSHHYNITTFAIKDNLQIIAKIPKLMQNQYNTNILCS